MRTLADARRAAVVLATSCHPGPVVAVTAFATALSIRAGDSAGTCALVLGAVGTGQLSIGWSNDRIDAGRDRVVHRTDKPLAASDRWHRLVEAAIGVALAGTVAMSLSLGWRAGAVHLAAVAWAWAYNLRLKSTVLSWLPYAVSFGLLPAVATLALPAHLWPPAWVIATSSMLGVTAHFANVIPDLDGDRATGVIGLPHRLGARGAVLSAAALGAGATLVVALAPAAAPTAAGVAGLAVALAIVLAVVAVTVRNPASKVAFYGVIAVAAVDLAVLLSYGRLR
jgi:4-hydroxybenzoate polyprenyltransferase